jgi:CMP-N-acetylneuraminic acid synthetase
MQEGRRILVVVPARGGSKGVKLKNLEPVGGVPLVARVGELVRELDWVDRAVVSTDHPEIARVAADSGLDDPFQRPADLSGDEVGDREVLAHALEATEADDGEHYDVVVMLQPTSPLRRAEHVTASVDKLIGGGFDSVWTVSPTDSKSHPLKQLVLEEDRLDHWDPEGARIVARQQLRPVHHRNGAAYAITRECLLGQQSILGKRASALVIEEPMLSIDTREDFARVEELLAARNGTAAGLPRRRVIFQPLRGRPLHRLLWKRLRLPRRLVHSLLSAAKVALNPVQFRLRRQLAEEIGSPSRSLGAIPPSQGYLRFAAGKLPGADAAARRCAEIFEAARAASPDAAERFNPNKRFLLSILSGAGFCEYPELIRFMVSRPILDAATAYLGSVPLLAGAALWWSPRNETARSSQLYHLDNEDWSQVKLLINVFDVTDDHGPFTFLPADVSEEVRDAVGYVKGRVDDARIGTAGEQALKLVGRAGSGAFVDTARCLHFGSRANRRDRLLLMVQFLRFHSPTESTFRFQVPPDLPGLDPDPVQRLALGIE